MARQPRPRVQPRAERPRKPLIALPKHPYRDGAIFHGILALLLVFVAWLTGGGIGRAIVVGALYFVAATAWTWWRFRQRLERQPGQGATGKARSEVEEDA
jgi:hypothetical protein